MLYRTCRLKRERYIISQKPLNEFFNYFSDWISFPNDFSKNHRNRFFSVHFLFWLFLFQVFNPHGSCRKVVLKAIAFFASRKQKSPSPNTASYCKARKKLSLNKISEIFYSFVRHSQEETEEVYSWCGRSVKVVDGTTCTLPDTRLNQKEYPQPGTQKPGCGFPMMRLVVIFSLSMGTVLKWSKGAYRASERSLFRSLIDSFKKGDVFLADRGFNGFLDFQESLGSIPQIYPS